MADGQARRKKGSILAGALWMVGLSVLLFWLPILGPLIAGIVGGWRAGGLLPAIGAYLLPGIIAGVAMFLLATGLTGVPLLGALAGAGSVVFALGHSGSLLVGAVVGGILTWLR
jgi:hypothetical protein